MIPSKRDFGDLSNQARSRLFRTLEPTPVFLPAGTSSHVQKRAVVFVLTTFREDSDRFAAYGYHVAGDIVKRQDSSDFFKVATLLEEYFGSVLLPST